MPARRESIDEREFVAWIESQGCECLKLRIDGADGFPDRTVIAPHGVAFFEFKRKGGSVRPQQRKMIARLNRQRAPVFVVYSCQEAKEKFHEWFREFSPRIGSR